MRTRFRIFVPGKSEPVFSIILYGDRPKNFSEIIDFGMNEAMALAKVINGQNYECLVRFDQIDF